MVARAINLPNIKRLFIPDPGYLIADSDLAQADAQVVAWEADDEDLKTLFRDPNLDLHDENTKAIYGSYPTDSKDERRKKTKAGVHLTNYFGQARTLARALGITVKEADDFQTKWFGAHPGIKDWHWRIEAQLAATRTVSNKFGYKRFYFDRIDKVLPQALAWIPQSTVGLVVNKGLDKLDQELYPRVIPLLQVHDSIVYQFKRNDEKVLPLVKKCIELPVPYDDPLVIGMGLEVSTKSWADCEERNWPEENADET